MSEEKRNDALLSEEELTALRQQQNTRRAFYSSAGPGFKESSDAIDLLLSHIDALEAVEVSVLREALGNVISADALGQDYEALALKQADRIKALENAMERVLYHVQRAKPVAEPSYYVWSALRDAEGILLEVAKKTGKANG